MRERYILVVLSLRLVRISTRYAPPRAGTSARARVLTFGCFLAEGMMPCPSHPSAAGACGGRAAHRLAMAGPRT